MFESNSLEEMVKYVETYEQLAEFINRLRQDFIQHTEDWENVNIDSFLEAMEAWVRDTGRYSKHTGENRFEVNPFRFVAQVLLATKIYE